MFIYGRIALSTLTPSTIIKVIQKLLQTRLQRANKAKFDQTAIFWLTAKRVNDKRFVQIQEIFHSRPQLACFKFDPDCVSTQPPNDHTSTSDSNSLSYPCHQNHRANHHAHPYPDTASAHVLDLTHPSRRLKGAFYPAGRFL